MTAKDSYLGVILSVVLSAAVSFLITAVILRASRKRDLAAEAAEVDTFSAAVAQNAANKGGTSRVGDLLGTGTATGTATATKINSIVFACDAGMGSSAMGATVVRTKLKKAGITDVTVRNEAIANLTDDIDLACDTDKRIFQKLVDAVAHQTLRHRQLRQPPALIAE